MLAGRMDRVIRIKRATVVSGGFGKKEEFALVGPVLFAERRDMSDQEKQRAGETEGSLASRFTVRWTPFTSTITSNDILVHEGRDFTIVGVKEAAATVPASNRRRAIQITTSIRTDQRSSA